NLRGVLQRNPAVLVGAQGLAGRTDGDRPLEAVDVLLLARADARDRYLGRATGAAGRGALEAGAIEHDARPGLGGRKRRGKEEYSECVSHGGHLKLPLVMSAG